MKALKKSLIYHKPSYSTSTMAAYIYLASYSRLLTANLTRQGYAVHGTNIRKAISVLGPIMLCSYVCNVFWFLLLVRNSLHLVVNEVYMKCILDPSEVFTSVLELE